MISIPFEMRALVQKIPDYKKEELRSIRARHGLSRTDLANLLAVNRSTVSRWESADGCPRLAALAYLVLEKAPSLLLGSEERNAPAEVLLAPATPRYALLKTSQRRPKKEWPGEDVRSLLKSVGKNFYLKDLAQVSGLSAPTVATWTAANRSVLPKRTRLWLNLLWCHRLCRIKTCEPSVYRLQNGENLAVKDILGFLDADGHFLQCSLVEDSNVSGAIKIKSLKQYDVDAKKTRVTLGLTQEQLSKILGVSTLSVKNWEKSSVEELKGPSLRLYDFVRAVGLPAVKMLENLA